MEREPHLRYAYAILMDEILHEIGDGTYEVGTLLPTQVELAKMYNVSRVTVREAMQELVRRGIIESKRGYGTVVKEQPLKKTMEAKGQVTNIQHSATANVVREILTFERLPATQNLAKHFQTEIGAPLLYIRRIKRISGEVVSLDIIYLPYSLIYHVDFSGADLTTQSLTDLLRTSGIEFAEVQEHFRAALATKDLAERMKILVGEPIIRAQRYAMIRDHVTNQLVVGEYSEHYIRTDMGPVVIRSKT